MSTDLDFVFRKLKSEGIGKRDVAKTLVITSGWLSKIIGGKANFSAQNIKVFNNAYGHIIKIEDSSLKKSDQSGQNDLLKIRSEQKTLRVRIERIEKYLKLDSVHEKDTPENVQVKDKIRKDISAGKGKKSK